MRKMSDKMLMFCIEYVNNGGDHKDACRKAGYMETYVKTKSHLLLRRDDVKEKLQELRNQRSLNDTKGQIADQNEIMVFWSETMRSKFAKNSDRITASVNLGKAHGMFVENVNIDANIKKVDHVLTSKELEELAIELLTNEKGGE